MAARSKEVEEEEEEGANKEEVGEEGENISVFGGAKITNTVTFANVPRKKGCKKNQIDVLTDGTDFAVFTLNMLDPVQIVRVPFADVANIQRAVTWWTSKGEDEENVLRSKDLKKVATYFNPYRDEEHVRFYAAGDQVLLLATAEFQVYIYIHKYTECSTVTRQAGSRLFLHFNQFAIFLSQKQFVATPVLAFAMFAYLGLASVRHSKGEDLERANMDVVDPPQYVQYVLPHPARLHAYTSEAPEWATEVVRAAFSTSFPVAANLAWSWAMSYIRVSTVWR